MREKYRLKTELQNGFNNILLHTLNYIVKPRGDF